MDATHGSASPYTLAEQLVLLAIDPRRGRLVDRPPGSLAYAVAGATLTALLRAGCLTVVDGQVYAGPDSGDQLTDTLLEHVRAFSTPQSLGYWVNALTMKPLVVQAHTLAALIDAGVVAAGKRRVLGVLTVTRYQVLNQARAAAVAALRDALTSQRDLDAEQASLLTLAASCGLIDRVVERSLRGVAHRRVRDITLQAGELTEALAEQGSLAYAVAGEVYGAVCSGGHGGGGHGGGGHGGGHGGH